MSSNDEQDIPSDGTPPPSTPPPHSPPPSTPPSTTPQSSEPPPSHPPRSSAAPAASNEKFEYQTVKAIRGRENATITKFRNDGWDLESQTHGTLRSELTFRRVKPQSLAAKALALYQGLTPTGKKAVAIGAGTLVLIVLIGGLALGLTGDDESPEAVPTPAETSDDSADEGDGEGETSEPEKTDAPEPAPYAGPPYEIVTVDENVTPADLRHFWVYTEQLDYSTDAYKDQAKQIIADIAREEGTAEIMVDIVSDREVILSEAASTYEQFDARHGFDYVQNVVGPKQAAARAATYRGGYDSDSNKPSTEDSAFEVIWRIASDSPEFEKWKPGLKE